MTFYNSTTSVMKLSYRRGPEQATELSLTVNEKLVPDGANAQLPKSIGPTDAPRCEAACRTEFTRGMGVDPGGDPTIVLESLCRKILDDHLSLWFHDLYCCDSIYCGVNFTTPEPVAGLDRESTKDHSRWRAKLIGIQLRLTT